jgi:putative copper export protein/methionine-rich copper-binding protein CopC/ABC-type branched-subunit amino acid transport system substrate-binding protein
VSRNDGHEDRGPTAAVLRRVATGIVVALALVAAPAASAHPYLIASTPQAGVVAPTRPQSVQIAFTERLVLQGCSITVRDAEGKTISIGRPRLTLGGDGLTAQTGTLPEGVYTVSWVALGDDGHTVAGSYQFGVPSPAGLAPPGADRLLATTVGNGAEQAPTESFVSIAGRWLAAIGGFLLLGGAVLLLTLRGVGEPEVRDGSERRWRRLALAALAVATVGTVIEALERMRGPGSGLDLGLLTGSPSGVAVLVRLGVLLAGAALLRALPARRRTAWLGCVGALALGALALDGHVATVRGSRAVAVAEMVVHLLSAGVWVGAVIVLAACVAPAALAARRPVAVLSVARRFAPVAATAAVLTIATGLLSAFREVAHWYFLRFSSYGHLLIVKAALVVIVLGLGAGTTWIARRAARGGRDRRGRRAVASRPGLARGLLAAEAVAGVAVVAVATILAGTLQGAGQPLPSQRGDLLPGAGYADIALRGSAADVTLAPARPGLNRVVVAFAAPYGPRGAVPPAPPRGVSVSLSCACGGARPIGIKAKLHPGAGGGGAWYADVGLPLAGTWDASLEINGQPTIGSPAFTVGVSGAPGAPPLTVASVADLSGPDALDCRSQEIGALMSIELMNAVGGVGGRKVTQEVLDDGGNPALARADALRLAAQHPVAFLAPCGQGAAAAVEAVGNQVPTIVADSSVPVVQGRRVFRLAPNPYAEGYASGEYIGQVGLPTVPKGTPRRVDALVSGAPDSRQRLQGLEQALARYNVAVSAVPAGGPGLVTRLRSMLPTSRSLGIYLDGQFGPLSSALRQLGPEVANKVEPTAIMSSSRLGDERFIEDSGELGREGQIRTITDVDPTSNGAQLYATLAPQIVGELPSLPGLSGFVAGQALAYGLIAGDSPAALSARLREPGVFSQAAISPWSDRDPADGTLMFRVFLPSFLTDNLIPVGPGMPGEVDDGQFFPDGDWETGASAVFTPLHVNLGSATSFSARASRATPLRSG